MRVSLLRIAVTSGAGSGKPPVPSSMARRLKESMHRAWASMQHRKRAALLPEVIIAQLNILFAATPTERS